MVILSYGEGFKTACEILGVHPCFAGSGSHKKEHLAAFMGTLPEKAQTMLRRVEKLLALWQSSNGDTSLPVAAVKALRVRCHAENNFEKNRLFPRLKKDRSSFRMDKNAFYQGMEQGEKTHINRPVEHKKTGITALLN